jgi:hypothetical protein
MSITKKFEIKAVVDFAKSAFSFEVEKINLENLNLKR